MRSIGQADCGANGVGELLWATPHGPVPGRQVDHVHLSELGHGAEHGVALRSQFEDLGTRQGATDEGSGHGVACSVGQLDGRASDSGGFGHGLGVESGEVLVVETLL